MKYSVSKNQETIFLILKKIFEQDFFLIFFYQKNIDIVFL